MRNSCSIYLLAFITFIFSACGGQPSSSEYCSFDLDGLVRSVPLYTNIEDYDIVALHIPENDSVSDIRKILVCEDDYVVLERSGRVLRFDSDGVLESSHKGSSADTATDIFVSGNVLYVLADKRITGYDDEWDEKDVIDLEYSSIVFHIASDGTLVTAGATAGDGKVVHVYSCGELTGSSLDFPARTMLAMSMKEEGWAIQESEGKLFLSLPLCETLYEIADGEASPFFTFKSGKDARKYIGKAVTDDPGLAPGFWKGMEEKYFVAEKKIVYPGFMFSSGYYLGRPVTLYYDREYNYAAPYADIDAFLALRLFGGRSCHPVSDDTFVADLSIFKGMELSRMNNICIALDNSFEKGMLSRIFSSLGYDVGNPFDDTSESNPDIPESAVLDKVVLVKCKVR